jgi:hypothetical protein
VSITKKRKRKLKNGSDITGKSGAEISDLDAIKKPIFEEE